MEGREYQLVPSSLTAQRVVEKLGVDGIEATEDGSIHDTRGPGFIGEVKDGMLWLEEGTASRHCDVINTFAYLAYPEK